MDNGQADRDGDGRPLGGQSPKDPDPGEEERTGPQTQGTTPRLYERAYEILAQQIRDGAYPPGTRLRQTTVASQFGISRAPARQALEMLARDGLVDKGNRRGFLVRLQAGKPLGTALPIPGSETPPPQGAPDMRLTSAASWQRIYAEVESEIVARTAFAGWKVNETELARCYQVSRTVARDVIGRLQQRGVLRKDDRSRWYAPALNAIHVDELYELRWLLEPVALAKAAPHVPPGVLGRLQANLEAAIADGEAVSGPTLDQLEEELHVELLGYCGNQTLIQAITLQQSLLIAHHFLYRWAPQLFGPEPILPEHLQVVERLAAGQPTEAAAALETHLRRSRERTHTRIKAIRGSFTPDPLPYLERIKG